MVADRRGEPFWSLEELRELIEADAWQLATDRCRKSVRALGLLGEDVKRLLLAIEPRDFRGPFGRCGTDFGDVDGDAYRLWYDEDGRCRCGEYCGTYFYIKLAIHTNDEGSACLVISLHVDSRP